MYIFYMLAVLFGLFVCTGAIQNTLKYIREAKRNRMWRGKVFSAVIFGINSVAWFALTVFYLAHAKVV